MGRSGFFGRGMGPSAFGGSGLAAPVPVAGNELVVNGGFDANSDWSKASSWSISNGVAVALNANGAETIHQYVGVPGAWCWTSWTLVSRTSGEVLMYRGVSYLPYVQVPGTYVSTTRSTGNTVAIVGNNGFSGTVDNISYKPLTLSSLFSTRVYASANCDLSVGVTRTASTQAGLVARLDSASSPANFVIAYLDGASVKVDKCVAGTYTNIISGAVTYGATKILRLVCNGNNVSAYYDGTQVGTTQTVSDAGIVGNTRAGLFSTYALNSFSGYIAA